GGDDERRASDGQPGTAPGARRPGGRQQDGQDRGGGGGQDRPAPALPAAHEEDDPSLCPRRRQSLRDRGRGVHRFLPAAVTTQALAGAGSPEEGGGELRP